MRRQFFRLSFSLIAATLIANAAPVEVTVPALADDPECTTDDRTLIARTYELARASAAKGDGGHGALLLKDGKVVLEFASATNSTGDVTKHAETGLISLASRTLGRDVFAGATLYTSEEPCIMCMGSVRAAGLKSFVYGTTASQARLVSGRPPVDRWLECREVYTRLEFPITIRGPLMEAEGLQLLADAYAQRMTKKK